MSFGPSCYVIWAILEAPAKSRHVKDETELSVVTAKEAVVHTLKRFLSIYHFNSVTDVTLGGGQLSFIKCCIQARP
jgi:hypothetical protein